MIDVISVLSNANKADIQAEPFPHIVVRNALPRELFDELFNSFPTLDTVAENRIVKSNKLYILSALEFAERPEIAEIWRKFFDYHTSRAFFFDMADFWQDFIAKAYPDIEADLNKQFKDFTTGIRHPGARRTPANLAEDIQLDCQLGVNSAVERVSSVRGPHIDSRYKLIAGLLYFRDPEDDSTGGELELSRYRNPNFHYAPGTAVDRWSIENMPVRRLSRIKPRHVELVRSIPYATNVLVMWLNMPHAIHGVSPRQPTGWTRRYVNFLGEVYGGQNDGFFETRRQKRLWPLVSGRKTVGSAS